MLWNLYQIRLIGNSTEKDIKIETLKPQFSVTFFYTALMTLMIEHVYEKIMWNIHYPDKKYILLMSIYRLINFVSTKNQVMYQFSDILNLLGLQKVRKTNHLMNELLWVIMICMKKLASNGVELIGIVHSDKCWHLYSSIPMQK